MTLLKKFLEVSLISFTFSACIPTADLAKTLRFSDNTAINITDVRFQELKQMKQGESCTFNLFKNIPLFGDGSLITAIRKGDINTPQIIGERGTWYFPFTYTCTVVFGDSPNLHTVFQNTQEKKIEKLKK